MEAIDVIWFAIHGEFKNLVIDGESSLNCAEAQTRLKDKGILVKAKAPGQHARMVERRHAILRHAMHVAEEQLIDEGIRVTFKQLLAHCTFAGNELISYGGATPYNARFGRQPALLLDLHSFPDNEIPDVRREFGKWPCNESSKKQL